LEELRPANYQKSAGRRKREREDNISQSTGDEDDRLTLYEGVFEQPAVGIVLNTLDGQWLRANRKLGDILKRDPDELSTLTFSSIIHPDDFATHVDLQKRVAEGTLPIGEHEARLIQGDGDTTWSFITISPVLGRKSEPDHLTVFEHIWRRAEMEVLLRENRGLLHKAVEDASRRKRAERAVRKSEQRFRDFSEAGSDWLWEFDKDLRYSFIAPGSLSSHEYDVSGFLGKYRADVKPAGIDDDDWQAHLNDLRSHRPFRDFVQPRELDDGSVRWLSVSGKPLFDDNGEFAGYRGTAADITERRELERLKREFVSTVSHELRTPLTSIKGSFGLVIDGALGELPDAVVEMLRIAHRNTERLSHLVNDILDMEKLDSGNIELDFETLDLSDLVRDTVQINQGLSEEFSVGFNLPNLPPDVIVRGDRNRLGQAITNLLSNAAKFSPEGGRVEISVDHEASMARVSVADFGPGIPDEFHDQIFDRFAQLNASDDRQTGGTGLGLGITKSIVELHGGTVTFQSQVGAGTTFYLALPISK